MPFSLTTSTTSSSHSLFGDGCGAVVIGASQVQHPLAPGKVVIRDSFSRLLDDAEDGIVLGVNHNGITCELSENLPDYIYDGVDPVIAEVLADNGLQKSDVDLWAIHPGGPKIIEESVRSLGIPRRPPATSWDVLARFGNMLSVSLLFVLELMVEPGRFEQEADLDGCGVLVRARRRGRRTCSSTSSAADPK